MIFVTGGAGFSGSNFIHHWLELTDEPVCNIDKLTYAGNLENLAEVSKNKRYQFKQVDIADKGIFRDLLDQHKPITIAAIY